MKCPYRTVIKYTKIVNMQSQGSSWKERIPCPESEADQIANDFMDCYGDECPRFIEGKCARLEGTS